ncbi:MAG: MBL fold metallo-hydrolase [Bacteroides sp.]|nr:MBL fold metallo-hydrolase [Bacteroides sp.]
MIKLQYIWHDCFLFENEKVTMVFDFWKDPLTEINDIPMFIRNLDKEKPLYVFVSHHHKDHYVKNIFEWGKYIPNITYILSKDTAKFARHIISETSLYTGIKPDKESVKVLSSGETFRDNLITVDAFGSTDIGNSYAIKTGDTTIFHAGDLNAWIWKDESTEKEVATELKRFTDILDKIAESYPRIDLAMFPVDSRIGTDYFTGAKIFVREINVAHFFPMHFGLGNREEQLKYQLAAATVGNYANPERGEYICLQSPYACYIRY